LEGNRLLATMMKNLRGWAEWDPPVGRHGYRCGMFLSFFFNLLSASFLICGPVDFCIMPGLETTALGFM
jgi:hypothetical protein